MQAFLVSLTLLGLLCGGVRAEVDDLYTGSAPVESQSADEAVRVLPRALEQVLQKLTGLREFDDPDSVRAALVDARSMAISYYYRNLSLPQPDGTLDEQRQLVARFNPAAVDRLMDGLQLRRWPPQRKPVAIWLVVDDGTSRRIMPIELDYALQRALQAATDRGMPYQLPQPNEEGEYPVDVQLLWGGYTEETADAPHANVLVIAARREGPEWNARMNLGYGGQNWSWRNRAAELQDALIEGMNRAVDEIAAVSSIAATDLGHWDHEIRVTGLASSTDYARCLAYLQGLNLVEHVGVLEASPGAVRFRLALNALPEHFETAVDADGVLERTTQESVYSYAP